MMMKYSIARTVLAVLATTISAHLHAQDAIDFNKHIAPLFAKNCSACHNIKKPEGGLVLESFTTMMKGGDSGAAVVPNATDKGELLARIVATDDSEMPPKNNTVGAKRLTDAEVMLIKTWVAGGAMAPKEGASQVMNWRDITEALKPIYASDASPDGNYLSYGLGNTVALVTNPFGATTPKIEYLIDPDLKLANGQSIRASDLDLIQSLAFSPDSQRLASGGYRTVKIWKRQTASMPLAIAWPAGSKIIANDITSNRLLVMSPDNQLLVCDANTTQVLTSLKGHSQPVTAASWAMNTQSLFSCDASGLMIRWNLPTELPPEMAFVESAEVATTASSPIVKVTVDAKDVRALTAASPTSVLMLRTNNKVTAMQQPAPTDAAAVPNFAAIPAFDRFENISSVAVAKPADTIMYLIANTAGIVEVVKTETAESTSKVEQGAAITALAVSRDGSKLTVASTNAQTKTWNLADGKQLAVWQGDYDHVRNLQMAEKSVARQKAFVDFLAARVPELKKEAEKEAEARKKVEEARTKQLEAIAAKVKEVDTAKAAVTATAAAMEETKKAIEEANKKLQTLTAEMEAKQKAVAEAEKNKTAVDAELPKHDQALATATEGVERANALIPKQEQMVATETMLLTTAQQGLESLKAIVPPTANALAFDATGTQVIATAADNSVNVFDSVTGKPIAKLQPSPVAVGLALVTSEQKLVAGDSSQLDAWNLNFPWQLERVLGGPMATLFSDRITALDFSPDGQQLAIGSGPPSRFGDVKLVSVATGEVQRDMGEVHSDTVLGLRYSPDGRQLATAAADKLCKLFQLDTGTAIKSFEGHTHHVLAVAWQNDGQTLATASADNTVKSWTVGTGERKQSIAGFGKEVTALRFVAQTDQVLSSSVDGQVKLHNASNAQQVRVFSGANTPLYTLSVSPDGQFVVGGGQSGVVWIWKVADGQVLKKLP
jgi:WD40 repeat protein